MAADLDRVDNRCNRAVGAVAADPATIPTLPSSMGDLGAATVIVLDIAVLWRFWPDILPRTRLGRGPFSARRIVAAFGSTALIGFSIAIATFPGEAVYENWIARNIQIPEAPVSKGSAPPLVPLTLRSY